MEENNQNQSIAVKEEREKLQKEARLFEKSPWVFLIMKNKLTYLIIIFLLVFGLLTIKNLPRELNPEVQIPIAIVATIYPGASPLDVEEQITNKIENNISNLEGLKRIDSSSSLGVSSVVVEFQAGRDIDDSIRNLKDEVSRIENELPSEAFSPDVMEINFSDQPIFTATLSGENYDLSDLKKIAEDIGDQLKTIPFVSKAEIVGGSDRIIKIDFEKDKLAEKNISINQVIAQISSNNINFPVGSIDFDNFRYSIRIEGGFEDFQEISQIQIGSENGTPILLGDVANVYDGFGKEFSLSRISFDGNVPKESVSIQLYKKTGGDIMKVAKSARDLVENGKGSLYPSDVDAEITSDESRFISESIGTLSFNGLQTVLIILILLFIFLGWREALVAGLAVPFSFFVAFIIMSILGESLNFLSLFALVLALGLLVDSAIVVVEGMYRKVGHLGLSGREAAISTVKEYGAPLLSGMLTTVAAFFPLMFVKGIIGDFMKVIPIVVNTTLIAALFVALTIVPAIGALVFRPVLKTKLKEIIKERTILILWICRKIKSLCSSKPRRERRATLFFEKISKKYFEFLPKIIGEKKNRRRLYALVTILFFLAIALPISGLLKVQSFGKADSEYFYVNLEMPQGTLLEKTDLEAKKIEKVLLEEKEVVNFVTNVGSGLGSGFTASSGEGRSNQALFLVNLTEKESRKMASYDIVAVLRSEFEKIQDLEGKVSFTEIESGPPSGAPIELRVVGEDLLTLENLAEEIKNELAQIPTVVDAETSVKFSAGEFVFHPNRQALYAEGISVGQIAQELRAGIAGNDSIEIKKDGSDLKILASLNEDQISNFNDLSSISIASPSGKSLALSELGSLGVEASLSSISHRDKERVVTISAKTQGGNPTEITKELEGRVGRMEIPSGYRVDFGGESEELTEIFQDMLLKMIIGIILILFILVIQFNSYRQVFIVLATIPLALIGVFFGMAGARLILDIPAFVGIVSLVGIVVNNAIILMDQMNKEIASGRKLIDSVRTAGYNRLRPIVLTSVTTIFGLLPLSITQPDWRNMGFTIIFGLVFSTFLTLFVIPSIFVSFYEKKIK